MSYHGRRVPRCFFMIACLSLAACQDAPSNDAPTALRVSAGHQLTSIAELTGSTAYAYDLVYLSRSRHVRIEDRDGTLAALVPRDASQYPASFLCEHLIEAGGITGKHVRDNTCEITFASVEDKRRYLPYVRIEIGPYQVAREVPRTEPPRGRCAASAGQQGRAPLLERIELRGDGSTAIDEIHIVSMPLHEQWRSLFARQIDVIPSTPIMYRAWFEEMSSVRTVALPSSNALALYFNTSARPWSQRDARRALVRTLDMDAIARVACREPECRSKDAFGALGLDAWDPVPPPDAPTSLPEVITIHVLSDDSSSVTAAEVMSFQIRDRMGLDVHIRRHCLTELDGMLKRGEFGLLLMPLPQVDVEDGRWRDRGDDFLLRLSMVARYANQALDDAMVRQDRDRVAAIMQRDVPVVPLFQYLQFAAIEQRFCGPEPDSATSWRWLAALHPCGHASQPQRDAAKEAR